MKFFPINNNLLGFILFIGFWSCHQESMLSVETSARIYNLEVEKNDSGVLYPIPTQEQLNLLVSSPENGEGIFEVLDLDGNLLEKNHQPLIKGINKMELALPGLAAGFYLLRLSQDGQLLFQQEFMVQ